jgi:hypothetical protein
MGNIGKRLYARTQKTKNANDFMVRVADEHEKLARTNLELAEKVSSLQAEKDRLQRREDLRRVAKQGVRLGVLKPSSVDSWVDSKEGTDKSPEYYLDVMKVNVFSMLFESGTNKMLGAAAALLRTEPAPSISPSTAAFLKNLSAD